MGHNLVEIHLVYGFLASTVVFHVISWIFSKCRGKQQQASSLESDDKKKHE